MLIYEQTNNCNRAPIEIIFTSKMFHAKENENLRQNCLDLQLFSLYVQSRVGVWPCVLPSGGEGQTTIVI